MSDKIPPIKVGQSVELRYGTQPPYTGTISRVRDYEFTVAYLTHEMFRGTLRPVRVRYSYPKDSIRFFIVPGSGDRKTEDRESD